MFDMAQIDSAPLQKNLWQDLGGSRSVEAENFATKNFARRMTKKNFLAATKSDAIVTQPAKDKKWAHLRPAHPGLVWTPLHETMERIHALPEDEKVINICVREVATLVVVHTKTDTPGDQKFSVTEDQQKAASAQLPKEEAEVLEVPPSFRSGLEDQKGRKKSKTSRAPP